MSKTLLIILSAIALLMGCSKKDDPSARRCYADRRFTGIQAFYCLTNAEVAEIKDKRLKGETQVSLSPATDADKAKDTYRVCAACQ